MAPFGSRQPGRGIGNRGKYPRDRGNRRVLASNQQRCGKWPERRRGSKPCNQAGHKRLSWIAVLLQPERISCGSQGVCRSDPRLIEAEKQPRGRLARWPDLAEPHVLLHHLRTAEVYRGKLSAGHHSFECLGFAREPGARPGWRAGESCFFEHAQLLACLLAKRPRDPE